MQASPSLMRVQGSSPPSERLRPGTDLAEDGVALVDVRPQLQLEIIELVPIALLQLVQRQTSSLRTSSWHPVSSSALGPRTLIHPNLVRCIVNCTQFPIFDSHSNLPSGTCKPLSSRSAAASSSAN